MSLILPLFKSLKTRVTLFALTIFLVGIWSLVIYASHALHDDMQQLLSDQQFSAVSTAAADIDYKLQLRLQALQKVADRIGLSEIHDQQVLQQNLERRGILLGFFNEGVFAVDTNGTCIASAPLPDRIGKSFVGNEEIASALVDNLAGLGRPTPGPTKPYPLLTMAAPIHDAQHKVIGALIGQTDLSKPNFLDSITQSRYGKTGGYLLISLKYKLIITSADRSRIMMSTPPEGRYPVIDRFMRGYEGSAIIVNSHGQQVLVSTKNIPIANWLVAVQLPTAEVFAPIHSLQTRVLLAATVLSILCAALCWWVLRRELAPLLVAAKALRRQSEAAIAPSPLDIKRDDEIGTLIGGFNQLLVSLAQRQEQLNISEQRYRTLVEWSLEAILVHRNGHILYANPAAVVLLEAGSADNIVGSHLVEFVAPQYHSLVRERIKRTTELRVSLPLFEQVFISRKGTPLELEIQVTAITYDGQPATQAVMRNITQRKQIEQALRQSEARLRRIMESSMLGMIFWDAQGSIINANDAFLDMVGYSRGDLAEGRLNWRDLTPSEFIAVDNKALGELEAKGACTPYEKAFYRKSGGLVQVLVGSTTFTEDTSTGAAFILDMTARKQAEEDLRQSEENLAITLNSIGDAVIATDADGKVARMNPAAEQLTGWPLHMARGLLLHKVFNILDTDTRQPTMNPVQMVMASDTAISLPNNTTLVARDGREYQIFDSAAPIRNGNGQITGVVLVFRDATEDYYMRKALERTTEMLERTGEIAKVGGWELDLRTMELFWSRAAYRVLEHDENVVLTFDKAISLFAASSRQQIEQSLQNTIATGEPFVGEVPAVTHGGRPIWIRFYGTASYENGVPVLIRGALQDVTDSKLAEDQLRMSEENLAITLDSIGDAVIATDATGAITRMNPTAETLTGWTLGDAMGKPLAQVFDIADATTGEPAPSPVEKVMRRGEVVGLANHTSLRSRDGREYQIFDSAAPIRNNGGEVVGVVLVFSDVTEKYRTEEALRRSEASMVAAQARAHFGNWELDLQTGVGFWSAENFRFYGLPPDSPTPSLEEFYQLVHPDDQELARSVETRLMELNEPITIEIRTNPELCPPRLLSSTIEVIRDANGKPIKAVGTSLDITERKQAELALQSSLKEKEALLKEVHHRVKNNLQVITSLLRLEMGRNLEPAVKQVLSDMQGRVRSMALLHETLYRSGTFAAVDLASYLSQLCNQAFRSLNTNPHINLILDLQPIHVEMDQALPCGLLVNELISNCLKHAFPQGRQGKVRVGLEASAESIRIEVSDNGIGLPADLASLRQGSLGLQLVTDLATQLDGVLQLEPSARFILVFPAKNIGNNPGLTGPNATGGKDVVSG